MKQLHNKYGKVVDYIDKMFIHLDKVTDKQMDDIATYYSKSSHTIRGIIYDLEKLSKKKKYLIVK